MSITLFMRSKKIWSYRNEKCKACPLHKTDGNVCVMGRGQRASKIMFIGEAPGATEAETGLPFMGRAGKLLNGYIIKHNLEDVSFITNICKCRPPDNRKPTPSEINTCSQLYLKTELNIIKPNVIVLLGRTAIRAMNCEDFSKMEKHKLYNRWCEGYGSMKIIPTWHPAYCLRAGRPTYEQLEQAIVLAKEAAL